MQRAAKAGLDIAGRVGTLHAGADGAAQAAVCLSANGRSELKPMVRE
jgi:hypothetical protein